MAALPPIKRIFKEDLGADVPGWITRLLAPLNQFMASVYQALNKGLTFAQNIKSDEREFQVQAGTDPDDNTFSFPLTNVQQPRGVFVENVFLRDGTPIVFTAAPYVSWTWDSSTNTLQIIGITGLTNGTTYTVRVLVI